MAEVKDLIDAVAGKNPVEFGAAFDDIMRARAMDAVEHRRVELAQSIYGDEDVDVVEDEPEDDVVIDDEDLDLDLDLSDIDLEELDAELEDDEETEDEDES